MAFWFLLPAIFGFLMFFLIPTVRAIMLSFQRASILNPDNATGVGFDNYRDLWSDDRFWETIRVTTKFVAINLTVQTTLALLLAVMMDRLTKSLVVRGIVLLPWILPNILVGMLFLFLLDPTVGITGEVLQWFGMEPVAFLANTDWVIPALASASIWKWTGYMSLLLFAGMQTVPRQLYEAGALDGASEAKMFKDITLPLLRPVLALVLVVGMIGSFQVFDIVQAAGGGLGGTPGDPQDQSRTLYLYIYENAFLFSNKFGYAAAMATVLLGFLVVITIIQLRLLRANQSDLAT